MAEPVSRYGTTLASLLVAACMALSGCSKPEVQKVKKANPYDEAKMDFSSTASTVTNQPVPLPQGNGAATSVLPSMPPLDPSPVKEVRLDVTNKVIEIAPGVLFSGWTFGDEIPGPVVRARVGDRIRFTMTNRSAEMIRGVNFGMPMPHSMDFHSAMVSPQDKYRSIVPGETLQFEFTVNYPGVYMYHCGTPMILEHLAAGMYGMMVVEPKKGYPTKVDHEYAIVQSEFYAMLDPQGRKVDGKPLYVTDVAKAKAKQATQVVFNGRFNGMLEKPLPAKPGERVRLFVLNAGPSGTSSFHVVGTIFDRAWLEGNPDNQLRGMQTVLLGASSGLIVEFKIPEKGKYVIVDHEFADASMGAIGAVDATAADAQQGTGYGAAAGSPGAKLFAERCNMCHNPPAGTPRYAPDLKGVNTRHNDEWLAKWLADPQAMLASDPVAQKLFREWNNVPMPPTNLTPEQVQQVLQYMHQVYDVEVH